MVEYSVTLKISLSKKLPINRCLERYTYSWRNHFFEHPSLFAKDFLLITNSELNSNKPFLYCCFHQRGHVFCTKFSQQTFAVGIGGW